MPETVRHVGYALNAFPYDTLAELWACLESDVLRLKALVSPSEPLPVELRFSAALVRELKAAGPEVRRLQQFLATNGLELVTVNGFVLPRFHGTPVKERVYLPAWHESADRLQFTNDCLDLLAVLAPGASVSVPFGALKPVAMDAVAPNILRCAEHAQATGTVLALEPEPGLCVETTAEAIEFFERFVPARLRPHVGINFDLAHQLVEFEDLAASLAALQQHDILIAKIHVSNAAEMPTLKPFYTDSIYLHQTCGADATGQRVYFSLDWPTTEPPAGIVQYRIHYHLPVCPTALPSTLPAVECFLTNLPPLPATTPLIIETYTWPQQLRDRTQLVENIARELAWVRSKVT
jgi:sugar phosphate isomerase/epimerase